MSPQLQRQPRSRIKDHYCNVLRSIMREHDIEIPPHKPGNTIPPDASFRRVVQYTYDRCCFLRVNQSEHYRYRRYHGALASVESPSGRIAHVDIGCGAGVFSWALLDRVSDNGLPYGQIHLYGLDHSQKMINLAHAVRQGLAAHITDYPQLHYTHEVDDLLRDLSNGHHAGTYYIVTFGHVLVQIQRTEHIRDPADVVRDFTQVIVHILELMDGEGRCDLIAVDASSAGYLDDFESGWKALLSSLEQAGISHQLLNAPSGARSARVFAADRQVG